MKILVCPDKFKGSITAEEFCLIAKTTLRAADIETIAMADGGDGTLHLIQSLDASFTRVEFETVNAYNSPIASYYLSNGHVACIEMANICGIAGIPKIDLNIMKATTFGVGIAMKHAIQRSNKKIKLFAGGSATNDGGLGIAAAFGYIFENKLQVPLEPFAYNLSHINSINDNATIKLNDVQIDLYTDVKNLLLGDRGATYAFSQQKGASDSERSQLENGMKNLNEVVLKSTKRDISHLQGAGAGGGLAVVVSGLFGATINSATDYLMDWAGLENKIKNADLIITGEGKFDQQSLEGKLTGEIIQLCTKHDKKCIVICGKTELQNPDDFGLISLSSLTDIAFSNKEQTKQLLSEKLNSIDLH